MTNKFVLVNPADFKGILDALEIGKLRIQSTLQNSDSYVQMGAMRKELARIDDAIETIDRIKAGVEISFHKDGSEDFEILIDGDFTGGWTPCKAIEKLRLEGDAK